MKGSRQAAGSSSVGRDMNPKSRGANPQRSRVVVEIRAAEGGDDAKSLVHELLAVYARAALLHRL